MLMPSSLRLCFFFYDDRYAMSPLGYTPSSIEDDWTDEKIMSFLGAWKCGDPLPSNVISDVNPFSIQPWNAPGQFSVSFHLHCSIFLRTLCSYYFLFLSLQKLMLLYFA